MCRASKLKNDMAKLPKFSKVAKFAKCLKIKKWHTPCQTCKYLTKFDKYCESSYRLIWITKIKQTDLIFFILNNISCSTTFFGYWTTFFHPFVKTLSEIPLKELFVGRNSVFCWWTDILPKTGFRQNAESLITPFYRIFFGKTVLWYKTSKIEKWVLKYIF